MRRERTSSGASRLKLRFAHDGDTGSAAGQDSAVQKDDGTNVCRGLKRVSLPIAFGRPVGETVFNHRGQGRVCAMSTDRRAVNAPAAFCDDAQVSRR